MTDPWFEDAADAKQYMGEVGRLWVVWLVGLGALAVSQGGVAVAVGVALLIAMFVLMSPLQQRVHARYGTERDARKLPPRATLTARERALRQLTYGRRPFAEAVEMRGLLGGWKAVPWVVMAATLAAAAAVAVAWLGD